MPRKFCLKIRLVFFVPIAVVLISATSLAASEDDGIDWAKARKFYSSYIQAEILYLPDVFAPDHENSITASLLIFMSKHRPLFKNKTVLDIGTGSGILSLYAAKLGAKKIIATDINKNAVASTRKNAQRLHFSRIIEARYVSPQDISAYAVIKPNETFDVIVCNAPFLLDLNAPQNTQGIDKGDLGLSIIKGLEKHLKPKGVVILMYAYHFYHQVMVKFARYLGYEVQNYTPLFLGPEEEDVIFNYYLAALLRYHGISPGAFRFNWKEDRRVDWLPLQRAENGSSEKPYNGLIIIRKK